MGSLIIGFIGGLATGVVLTTIAVVTNAVVTKNNDIDNMEDMNV